jgi:hypothetical protein
MDHKGEIGRRWIEALVFDATLIFPARVQIEDPASESGKEWGSCAIFTIHGNINIPKISP